MSQSPIPAYFRAILGCFILVFIASCGGGGDDGGGDDAEGSGNTEQVSADAGAGRALVPGSLIVLDATGSISNNGPIVVEWRQISGPAVNLIDPSQARIEIAAPDFGGDATLVFEVRITAGGRTDTDQVTFVVSVTAANDAPVTDAGPDQQVAAASIVTLDGSGSFDPDGARLTFDWTQTGGYPVDLQPGDTDVSPSFTVLNLPVDATLTFELRTSDGYKDSVGTIEVTVKAGASGPYDLSASVGPDITVTEGDLVILTTAGPNLAGPGVTYLWEYTGNTVDGLAPSFTGADTNEVSFVAPGTTTMDFDRTLPIMLTISAGGQIVSDDINVEVWPVDTTAPSLNVSDPTFVFPANGVDFQPTVFVQFFEAGGLDPASVTGNSFFLTDKNGAVVPADVSVTGTRTIELVPTQLLDALEDYTVNLTNAISDRSGNAFAGASWQFRTRPDRPPYNVSAGPSPQFINVGEAVTLTGSASDDEQPSNTLSYAWTSANGLPITNANQAVASFTATEVMGEEFTLTVTDRSGESASASIYITALKDKDNAIFATFCNGCPDEGDDMNSGAPDAPVASMTRALELAGQGVNAKDIYLSGLFTVPATISLPDGVSIFGGFLDSANRWIRVADATSIVSVGASVGILARNITMDAEISQISLSSRFGASSTTGHGASSVALLIDGGTPGALTIRNNGISASRGGSSSATVATPANAGDGSTGGDGNDGGNDGGNQTDGDVPGAGGAGCNGADGGAGGKGGNGAAGGSAGSDGRYRDGNGVVRTFDNNGGGGRAGSKTGEIFTSVVPGGDGTRRDTGIQTTFASGGAALRGTALDGNRFPISVRGGNGSAGLGGIGGGGGGGGGGAPSATNNLSKDSGGAGGGGGGGGCGGSGGIGGYGGGGSFGIFLIGADAHIIDNTIRTSDGGNGGPGGKGGRGGSGASGGDGGSNKGEPSGNGANGGPGGAGNGGGGGAGGPGGPSVGIYRFTGASPIADSSNFTGNTFDLGDAGDGGAAGAGGDHGCCGYVDQVLDQKGFPGSVGATGRRASIY